MITNISDRAYFYKSKIFLHSKNSYLIKDSIWWATLRLFENYFWINREFLRGIMTNIMEKIEKNFAKQTWKTQLISNKFAHVITYKMKYTRKKNFSTHTILNYDWERLQLSLVKTAEIRFWWEKTDEWVQRSSASR